MGTTDIENVQKTLTQNLQSNDSLVMTVSDRNKFDELLMSYASQRDDLQKKMVSLLTQYDPSGLESDWVDCCNRGKDSLNNLNSSVPSQNGGGLSDLGLGEFYRGEMSIWTENARAEIALRAREMKTIHLANLKLIQDCNEELKKVLSDEKDVQQYVEGTFGAILDVLKKTLVFLNAIRQIKNYRGQPSIPDQAKQTGELLAQSYSQASDAAKRKNALLKILLDRIKLLDDLKDKLNQSAIEAASETGQRTAESLYVTGRNSPYEAQDWLEFGRDCKEKLQDESARSVTDADTLFDLLYHQLDELTQKSFETLSDDPSKWENWEEQIGQSFDSIQEALDNISLYRDTLVESSVKAGLTASIDFAEATIKTAIDDWKTTLNDIKDKLRRN
jgi:hypothetical protein